MTDIKDKSEPESVYIPLYDKNSREEEAELALKRTKITPGVAWTLVIMLMVVIFSEPLLQIYRELRRGQTPKVFEVVTLLPSFARSDKRDNHGFWRLWGTLATVGEIQGFDKDLEKSSYIGQYLLPRAQNFLTGIFKAGNEQAYVGVPGWLFYRPEVDYCTGKGFLNKDSLKLRARSGDSSTEAIRPDPRAAILDFRDKLKARGIELIVMPIPVKPMIQPDKLSPRYSAGADVIQNPSYNEFVSEMTAKGVRILDVSADLIAQKKSLNRPQYLETDTHWTAEAMECAAKSLATYIQQEKLLAAGVEADYQRGNKDITNLGDIAEMLKLPADQNIYKKQTLTINPITKGSESWVPDKSSDVIVMGDSFFNIYSLDGMGWGSGAGFVEQLSYELKHPLDKIVINAGGSFATRKELDNRMKRGQDPLAGKKLVIYEFAMRDLMVGDWQIYPMVDKGTNDVIPGQPGEPVVPIEPVEPVITTDNMLFSIDSVTPAVIEQGGKAVITYSVPFDVKINMTLQDASKKNIRQLSRKNEAKKAGKYTVVWDGSDTKGKPVDAGIYTIVITPVNDTATIMLPAESTITVTVPQTVNPPINIDNSPVVSNDLVVHGVVKAVSVSPKPGTVAYKDCVIAIDVGSIKVQSGKLDDSELLVFVWGMKDNNLTAASSYTVGQTITLKLTPWDKVEGKYGGYNRAELNGDNIDALNIYWGEGR